MYYRVSAFSMALLAACCVGIHGEDADAVNAQLRKAKVAYEEAVEKANSTMAEVFAEKVKEVAATGNLVAVKKLMAESEAFEAEGKLPSSRDMKAAVSKYQLAIKNAREAMDVAYDTAVRQYTKDLNVNKADFTKTEWEVFKSRGKVNSATAASSSPIIIHAAFYGQNVNWIDVTEKLRTIVGERREWSTVVNTADWGDPAPGYTGPRTLIVRYTVDGATKSTWQYQGKELVIR